MDSNYSQHFFTIYCLGGNALHHTHNKTYHSNKITHLLSLFTGFSDPLSAYANTQAFLDYRVMGFRECVAEVARYMTNVEGLDMKDPMRIRLLNHLENYLAQRELAINAAVAASAQMGIPKVHAPPILTPAGIAIQHTPGPFISIPSQQASPDHLSPPATFAAEGIPLNVNHPTPVISFHRLMRHLYFGGLTP